MIQQDAKEVKRPRPAPPEPGSLRQQIAAVAFYLSCPWRRQDPAGTWRVARGLSYGRAVE